MDVRVVYIDTLFFTNFALDYFLLLACAKICAVAALRRRIALSAVCGALYAAAAVLPGCAWLALPPLKLLVGAAMPMLAFGVSRRSALHVLVFFAVSAAAGGAVYAASMLGGNLIARIDLRLLAVSFLVCYGAITLVFRRAARAPERLRTLVLRRGNVSVTLRALVDTGNSLRDPATGNAVAVVFADDVAALLPGVELREIPYSAVGVCGTLAVFVPDYAAVDGRRRDLTVALSPNMVADSAVYAALL
ncbi:MAG: sigma-E processing peptidase SpoIIGA [Oscillospiraceae bacterium]|jgi:stage II sporulation protein GA (sporulation sigma-E factor processing peptidase)|nr:sigma-E processing peptidase SpoIIGA [Oscillospiraceae bacterium]